MYAFSPHPSTPPQLNPPPSPTSTLPLGFVHVSFIVVPVIPSSHCPPPPPPRGIVRLFLTSMSLVIFCLLFSSIDYVPVKGEIVWYLFLTAWLISLSIMLSSSIHGTVMRTLSRSLKREMAFLRLEFLERSTFQMQYKLIWVNR